MIYHRFNINFSICTLLLITFVTDRLQKYVEYKCNQADIEIYLAITCHPLINKSVAFQSNRKQQSVSLAVNKFIKACSTAYEIQTYGIIWLIVSLQCYDCLTKLKAKT